MIARAVPWEAWVAGALVVALLASILVGCGGGWRDEDTTANTIGARNEARVLDLCDDDDAGACTPAAVRARVSIAFCAHQRELAAHAVPFDGGPPCRNP